jgi:hypothetical protein
VLLIPKAKFQSFRLLVGKRLRAAGTSRAFAGSWRDLEVLPLTFPRSHHHTLSTPKSPGLAYGTTPLMPDITNEESYQTASDVFDVDPERCIAQAKKNLQVTNISSYYTIENFLLFACTQDSWRKGQCWRLFAEQMYEKNFVRCESMSRQHSR